MKIQATLLLLLAPAIAGCFAPSEDPVDHPGFAKPSAAPLPRPHDDVFPVPGKTYEYVAATGERLVIAYLGRDFRYDAWMNPREADIWNFTAHFTKNWTGPMFLEEAVDPKTGAIIQQTAWCGEWRRWEGEPVPRHCNDERGLVYFGASGLPGILGTPLFAAAMQQNTTKLAWSMHQSVDWPETELDANVRPSAMIKGCTDVVPTFKEARIRGLPFTFFNQTATFCPGYALPFTFNTTSPIQSRLVQSRNPVTFQLAATNSSNASLPSSRSTFPPWDEVRPPSPVNWTEPLFVIDEENLPFTTQEAHDVALAESEAYKSAMERGSIVVESRLDLRSGNILLPGVLDAESIKYERALMVTAPDGASLHLVVGKQTPTDPHLEATYTIEDEQTIEPFPGVRPGNVAPTQSRPGEAIAFAHALTGLSPGSYIWSGHTYRSYGPEFLLGYARSSTTSTFEVIARMSDPYETRGLANPYDVVIHGGHGGIIYFEVERRFLPFGPGST